MNYSVDFTKFFEANEILLADELWNFLSDDDNAMQQIIDIINAIASPQFMQKYEFLNDVQNRTANKDQYVQQLIEWKLFSEVRLINNETLLLERISDNKRMIRKFNQPIFKEEDYNINRLIALEHFIN